MLNINLATSKSVVKKLVNDFKDRVIKMSGGLTDQAVSSLHSLESIVTEYGLDTRLIDDLSQFIAKELNIFDNNISGALSLMDNVYSIYSQGASIPEPALKNIFP